MNKQTKRNKTKRNRQNKTKRRRNKTYRRRNRTNRRNNYKRNPSEFIPGNKGQGLFSIPEKQKPFKIILDNNHNKQFGNIIPGLREM
jgi:hypothetical protein